VRSAAKAAPATPARMDARDRTSEAPEPEAPAEVPVVLVEALDIEGMEAVADLDTVVIDDGADVPVVWIGLPVAVPVTETEAVALGPGADCPTM